jgi:hypothetical protein
MADTKSYPKGPIGASQRLMDESRQAQQGQPEQPQQQAQPAAYDVWASKYGDTQHTNPTQDDPNKFYENDQMMKDMNLTQAQLYDYVKYWGNDRYNRDVLTSNEGPNVALRASGTWKPQFYNKPDFSQNSTYASPFTFGINNPLRGSEGMGVKFGPQQQPDEKTYQDYLKTLGVDQIWGVR